MVLHFSKTNSDLQEKDVSAKKFIACFYYITFGSLNRFWRRREPDGPRKELAERFLEFFDVKGNQLRALNKQTVIRFFSSDEMRFLLFEAAQGQHSEACIDMRAKVIVVLKRCLTDKELVVEIKDIFRDLFHRKEDVEGVNVVRYDFEAIFEQHLKELHALACQVHECA